MHIFVVQDFKNLLELEAKYDTPSHNTSTINRLVDYYKQVYSIIL